MTDRATCNCEDLTQRPDWDSSMPACRCEGACSCHYLDTAQESAGNQGLEWALDKLSPGRRPTDAEDPTGQLHSDWQDWEDAYAIVCDHLRSGEREEDTVGEPVRPVAESICDQLYDRIGRRVMDLFGFREISVEAVLRICSEELNRHVPSDIDARRVSNLATALWDELHGGDKVRAAEIYDEINRELGTLAE